MNIVYSLFPKFLKEMDLAQLAEVLKECRFDAVDLLVRDGYWVESENIISGSEKFKKFMLNKGLRVDFATTGYSPDELLKDETPLKVLAHLGIKSFRMAYFKYNEKDDFLSALDKAHLKMLQMEELCAKYEIKAVYQIHHGYNQLIHHSLAALNVVKGLSSRFVGIMPDPGNQFREAHENWRRAILTLGPYVAAIGVKDGKYEYNPEQKNSESKGWTKVFAPCQEGVNNWYDIVNALYDVNFDGIFNFQPFYHENDSAELVSVLKDEVSYIRNVVKDVEFNHENQ